VEEIDVGGQDVRERERERERERRETRARKFGVWLV
jgi:hypothetical protein